MYKYRIVVHHMADGSCKFEPQYKSFLFWKNLYRSNTWPWKLVFSEKARAEEAIEGIRAYHLHNKKVKVTKELY